MEYKDNLYQEIDFMCIYGNVGMVDAMELPTVRRKIFIDNFKKFKEQENAESKPKENTNPFMNNKMRFE